MPRRGPERVNKWFLRSPLGFDRSDLPDLQSSECREQLYRRINQSINLDAPRLLTMSNRSLASIGSSGGTPPSMHQRTSRASRPGSACGVGGGGGFGGRPRPTHQMSIGGLGQSGGRSRAKQWAQSPHFTMSMRDTLTIPENGLGSGGQLTPSRR